MTEPKERATFSCQVEHSSTAHLSPAGLSTYSNMGSYVHTQLRNLSPLTGM